MWPENKRIEKVTIQMDVLAFGDAKLYCQLLQKWTAARGPRLAVSSDSRDVRTAVMNE